MPSTIFRYVLGFGIDDFLFSFFLKAKGFNTVNTVSVDATVDWLLATTADLRDRLPTLVKEEFLAFETFVKNVGK